MQVFTSESQLSQIERVLFLKIFFCMWWAVIGHAVRNMWHYWPAFHSGYTVRDNSVILVLKIITNIVVVVVIKLNLHSQYGTVVPMKLCHFLTCHFHAPTNRHSSVLCGTCKSHL